MPQPSGVKDLLLRLICTMSMLQKMTVRQASQLRNVPELLSFNSNIINRVR